MPKTDGTWGSAPARKTRARRSFPSRAGPSLPSLWLNSFPRIGLNFWRGP